MLKSNELLFKFLDSDKGESNRVSCIASFTGTVDRKDRVLFPGIWAPTISHFVNDGAIYQEHDYSSPSIGVVDSATEVGNRLHLTWEFLDTDNAQEAKELIKQRKKKGKGHYMSNGYFSNVTWFESGQVLLKYAERLAFDMSLFDTATIAAYNDWIQGVVNIPEDGWYESSTTVRPVIKQAAIEGLDSNKSMKQGVSFVKVQDLDELVDKTNSTIVTDNQLSDIQRRLLALRLQELPQL